jgi:hypothetical protein
MSKRNNFVARPSLKARVKAALALRSETMSGWADENGWHNAQLWMTLDGTREYPHIRDGVAKLLGVTRATVDREIDRKGAAA